MNKLNLRDNEVTLFLKGASRTSAMVSTLLAAVWEQSDRDDERKAEYLTGDLQEAMAAVKAHRDTENSPSRLSGLDLVRTLILANTLPAKLARVFKTAELDIDILIQVRDPSFQGSGAFDASLKDLLLKTGLHITVVAAKEAAQ